MMIIRKKKLKFYVFKSSIFNSMKEGVKVDVVYEKYDKSLTDKYHKYFTQALKEVEPLTKNTLPEEALSDTEITFLSSNKFCKIS